MKLTLINPPTLLSLQNVGTMKPSLPLGLAYVAGAARRAGHDVRVVDAIAMAPRETWRNGLVFRLGAGVEEIVEAIPRDSEVIGVGCLFSFLWPFTRELCRAIKQRFPEVPLIGGGEHFTAMPGLSLAEAPLDALVVGEGEETLVELLAAIATGSDDWQHIAGLALRRDGQHVQTPRRGRVRDVDSIPWPAWDLFQPHVYNDNDFCIGMRLGMSMPILATRGCPYQCTFCTSPNMWTTRWYPRNPVDVVDEIETYHRLYGAVNFPFHDLTAVIKRQWVIDFSREILRRGLRIQWQLPAGTRCEAFDDEVAGLMVASGCRYLAFAPESGAETTRRRIKKHLDRDNLLRAVEVSVRAGMHVTCYFMVGLPFDRVEDLAQTAELVRELARRGVEDISCHYFYPAPGTELYRKLDQAGSLRKGDQTLMAPLFFTGSYLRAENCYAEHMSAAELNRWRYWILLNFYGTRFASHPKAALDLARNVLADRETNKLEAFARELRMKLRLRRNADRANGRTRPAVPTAQ